MEAPLEGMTRVSRTAFLQSSVTVFIMIGFNIKMENGAGLEKCCRILKSYRNLCRKCRQLMNYYAANWQLSRKCDPWVRIVDVVGLMWRLNVLQYRYQLTVQLLTLRLERNRQKIKLTARDRKLE